MLLNTAIITEGLSEKFAVRLYGNSSNELHLRGMRFYVRGEVIRGNLVHVALASDLPRKPDKEDGALLISVGGYPNSAYFNDSGCCCLLIDGDADLYSVGNCVEEIFDRYSEWDAQLVRVIVDGGNFQDIVDLSEPIFGNPIRIMDKNFRSLAHSIEIDERDDLLFIRPDEDGMYPLGKYKASISGTLSNRTTTGVGVEFDPETGWSTIYSNLFCFGELVGVLAIISASRPLKDGDIALVCHLASRLESMMGYMGEVAVVANPFAKELQSLIEGRPVEPGLRRQLNMENQDHPYFCLVIARTEQTKFKLPLPYLHSKLRMLEGDAICFEHREYVVGIIPHNDGMHDRLLEFLEQLHLVAGASFQFRRLADAQIFYRQAVVALDVGERVDPDQSLHRFKDYVLRYMLFGIIGEFPLESLMDPGIRALFAHDVCSQTSYVKTLAHFLKNNMNMAETARELYVHRSTLWERINRIRQILDIDLDDPDEQLRLRIILKIVELGSTTIDRSLNCK